MKKHNVTLVKGLGDQYQVKMITNSIEPKVGSWLKPAEVVRLCDNPDWEVTLMENDTFSTLLGVASGTAISKAVPL